MSAPSSGSSAAPTPEQPEHPHNFEAQKEQHQRIRNDPDYDDWEYGTEPLPHEAWSAGSKRQLETPPEAAAS